MIRLVSQAAGLFLLASLMFAQTAPSTPAPSPAADDYSGMYTFLREGEFVQLTVEDNGQVTGFISRYGDLDSDKGAFLDQFFKTAKLDQRKLSFTTETVHGVWYEFKGDLERGEGKNPGDEAYWIMRGILTQNVSDTNKKVSSTTRNVVFKQFPQNAGE